MRVRALAPVSLDNTRRLRVKGRGFSPAVKNQQQSALAAEGSYFTLNHRLFGGRCGTNLQQPACRKIPNQIPIRCQKIVSGQIAQRAPPKVVEDPIGHLTLELVYRKKLQI